MARPTTSFALTDDDRDFMARKVEEGSYASNSEIMRAAMRLLKVEEMKVERLRAAIQAGIDSGPAEPFDFDEFLARKNAQPE